MCIRDSANTEFKLYDDGKWLGSVDEVKWNDTKTKAEFALGDGANIKLTEGGWYRITANTKKMLASIAKTGWEIIGDATPGGWDKGQLMTYNPKTKTVSYTHLDVYKRQGQLAHVVDLGQFQERIW